MSTAAPTPQRRRGNEPAEEALVWRRQDIRESSRLVTLLTRGRGRVTCLAKGAHRPRSALLGRIDFLNRLEIALAGRGVPLLGTARLLHEPRALRDPRRYVVAAHLADALDAAWLPDQPDPDLYDLTSGAVRLTERAPIDRLPAVVVGIEVRLLQHLGLLAPLDTCSHCGACDGGLYADPRGAGGLTCARHRERTARRIEAPALAWLEELRTRPGRSWPSLELPPIWPIAAELVGRWSCAALERRLPLRGMALHGPRLAAR